MQIKVNYVRATHHFIQENFLILKAYVNHKNLELQKKIETEKAIYDQINVPINYKTLAN